MRVVVIGGLGFVGSHLVQRLIRDGHDVAVIDNGPLGGDEDQRGRIVPSVRSPSLDYRRDALLTGAQLFRSDVAERNGLAEAIQAFEPDCIYYLAAMPLVRQVEANPLQAERSMALGLSHALGIVRDRLRRTRFVYTSSSMVYGHFVRNPVSEDAPTNPLSVYGALKLAGEVMTHTCLAGTLHESVVVRPSGVYGPTDIHRRVVQNACEAALMGAPFIAVNPAETYIDFTCVDDLVFGLAAAGEAKGIGGETFNLTYGQSRSIEELIRIVTDQAGPLSVVREQASPADQPRRGTLDIGRARRLLGYEPRLRLEAGIERYIAFMRSHSPPAALAAVSQANEAAAVRVS